LGAKKSEEASLFKRADVSSVGHGALPRLPGYFSAKSAHNATVDNGPEVSPLTCGRPMIQT